ncbi:uncharacterized protein EKO05_0006277 [Ascochyta rabiei]|uniref:Uncharacterized protein n=1 Tax=Didymella rabiei TaxID=5454 RepID=A0A163B1U0_DIDRA|nr:uncharacterized protein EKO05_0006277 [Ascochyta rabiei]KZM21527.1 hypothetical protein ST47_g7351 [Ascochyta rabiei]UPX15841.1 hypothetical protein EKO05_0006277 [Ascochyta rabiei]
MVCFSQTQTVAPVTQRPLTTTPSLSLRPQVPEPPFQAADPPSSQPPQLPKLPFSLRRSNAVRRSIAAAPTTEASPQLCTQATTEYGAASEAASKQQRRRQSPVRNFSLPTYHPKQPRSLARYYATALTRTDQAALARGAKNHNLRSWTPEEGILHARLRRNLVPTHLHMGADRKVRILPVIIVTKGQDESAHMRQLSHTSPVSRSRSGPSISPPAPVGQDGVHGRAASSGPWRYGAEPVRLGLSRW